MKKLILFALVLMPCTAAADVKLPALFGEHMVLQRETRAPVWGWAEPGEAVTVRGSWDGRPSVTLANDDGEWLVRLDTPQAGGPYTLTVQSNNEIVLNDVHVGEVWVCSGQSNMQWAVSSTDDAEAEIAAATHPRMRIFNVAHEYSLEPKDDCSGRWEVCDPSTIGPFSAVGYFFGRELMNELDVPVGLIGSNWGGTVAEAWTSARALRRECPEFAPDLARADSTREGLDGEPSNWLHRNFPTALSNGMIEPLIRFSIRGAIWYQGESNRARAAQYRRLFPAMIGDWRRRWKLGDFPFYFVQIAPFGYDGDEGEAAELREAQTLALALPNTGMAVTMDVGDPQDIHPRDKQTVGRRLALWALARTYGRDDIVCSGPLYRSMEVDGSSLRLSFEHAAGLSAGGAAPSHFTIAGEDQVFHPATARIDGEVIVVASDAVANPVAVRYAWGAADEPNVKNGAGLPAPSFRTDEWPPVSAAE